MKLNEVVCATASHEDPSGAVFDVGPSSLQVFLLLLLSFCWWLWSPSFCFSFFPSALPSLLSFAGSSVMPGEAEAWVPGQQSTGQNSSVQCSFVQCSCSYGPVLPGLSAELISAVGRHVRPHCLVESSPMVSRGRTFVFFLVLVLVSVSVLVLVLVSV